MISTDVFLLCNFWDTSSVTPPYAFYLPSLYNCENHPDLYFQERYQKHFIPREAASVFFVIIKAFQNEKS